MTFKLFMHHIDFCSIIFCANLQSALGFFFFFSSSSYFLLSVLLCVFVLILAPYLGRLEQIGLPLFRLSLPLGVSCLGMTDVKRCLRN